MSCFQLTNQMIFLDVSPFFPDVIKLCFAALRRQILSAELLFQQACGAARDKDRGGKREESEREDEFREEKKKGKSGLKM